MAAYSVITYIYENNEWLHEPDKCSPNVDYICVTDNPKLKSNHWKLVYDPLSQFKNPRFKFAYVKLHPFQYANTKHAVIIDGAIKPKTSLDSLVNRCGNGLLLKLHPSRNNLYDELLAWNAYRGLSFSALTRFILMADAVGASVFHGPLYETCCMVWSNNDNIKKLGICTFNTMVKLDAPNDPWPSNQLVLSMFLQSLFKQTKVGTFNMQTYFTRYQHNSNVCIDEGH